MITPLYAAILGIIFVVLSVRTLMLRRKNAVAIGTSDNDQFNRAIRAHANFAEYVPIALLLIFFLEQLSGMALWSHVLGSALIAGRVIHAYGVSQVQENLNFRVLGMSLTFVAILGAALGLLWTYLV